MSEPKEVRLYNTISVSSISGTRKMKLDHSVTFEVVEKDFKYRRFVIPEGFQTDFYSVPWVFQRWFPKWDVGWEASVLHDWLYSVQPPAVSREYADRIFYLCMLSLGVSKLKAWIKYKAVCLGGSIAWNKKERALENG